jgi:hypothetical protein
MFPCLAFGSGYWWICPIIMIAMMVLCFFMMRGHAGSMMCGPRYDSSGSHSDNASDRSLDILNRKNSQGINK